MSKKRTRGDLGAGIPSTQEGGQKKSRSLYQVHQAKAEKAVATALGKSSLGKRKSDRNHNSPYEDYRAKKLARDVARSSYARDLRERMGITGDNAEPDNGTMPMDTLGNMQLAKINRKLFGGTSSDRQCLYMSDTALTSTQRSATLYTATLPVMITGFKAITSINPLVAGNRSVVNFVIAILRQGQTAASISNTVTDNTFFTVWTPEQDIVLWHSTNVGATDTNSDDWGENTNRVFKLDSGDSLIYLARASANTAVMCMQLEFYVLY